MLNYDIVRQQFKKYFETFDVKDKRIAMKISHSYHVADLGRKLGKRLDLNEEELVLSETLGLLHDIGRFIQYEKMKSYNEVKTNINHGQEAINYLFQEGHIKDFGIPEKYYDIIKKAIFNHNKFEIEEGLNEKELFFAKLLRDIDKIDIFRQDATSSTLKNYDKPINKQVKKAFYNHTLVDNINIKTPSDAIVGELAFIFDINFKESYELLYDTDNLELFLTMIEVNKECTSEFDLIKKEIRKFLEERLED